MAYSFLCIAGAVVLIAAGLVSRSSLTDLRWFAILFVLAVVQGEISGRSERERRGISTHTHIDVTATWLVAGIVLMSPGWAALLAFGLHLYLWFRMWKVAGNWTFHRMLTSASAVAISCWCASTTVRVTGLESLSGHWAWPLAFVAAAVSEIVNLVLVAVAIVLRTGTTKAGDIVGSWSDNLLELVTLCLGVVAAVALQSPWPVAVLVVFPPLYILHSSALVAELQALALRDRKTGVLNNVGWTYYAEAALTDVDERKHYAALLMIDVDRFKAVNDTYGHLNGDVVLKEIATVISDNVRKNDLVGRYGGEEFVVLLPSCTRRDAVEVGERIRNATTDVVVPVVDEVSGPGLIQGLSISIGLAGYAGAVNLAGLLDQADRALYVAKETGRNRLVQFSEVGSMKGDRGDDQVEQP